jgi:hypothetical protein
MNLLWWRRKPEMHTQLDRIEATQKKILDALKLKEQLDRIETGMAVIAATIPNEEKLAAEARDIASELGKSTDEQVAAIEKANQANQ